MKPLLTKAELHFLLGKTKINKTHIKQLEYLEKGTAILRAVKILYPERVQTVLGIFILLSIFNTLEHKFVAQLNPQILLLILTITSNGIGLFILHKLGAAWITKGINTMNAGLLPATETYRTMIVTLAATLFLIPGIIFSIISITLIIPPVTSRLAEWAERIVLNKFEKV